jgi:hypothetical protein
MGKRNTNRPAQWVVNPTDQPIGPIGWNGKTYIWDPNPKHAKAGQAPKMYALKAQRGKVDRGEFFRGEHLVKLKEGNGIIGPDKLVEITPADKNDKVLPEYKHLCDPDFVAMLRGTNEFDGLGAKNLIFTDTLINEGEAAVSRAAETLTKLDALAEVRKAEIAKMDEELKIKLAQAKQLDAKKG